VTEAPTYDSLRVVMKAPKPLRLDRRSRSAWSSRARRQAAQLGISAPRARAEHVFPTPGGTNPPRGAVRRRGSGTEAS
jgi:hypothetical protein